MLYTFSSSASADILMFGEPAQRLLGIIGKDTADRQGIVTLAQLPEAIDRLNRAVEEERARQTEAERQRREQGEEEEPVRYSGMTAPVSLAQRAWPLLEMMQTALKEEIPITWRSS